jgi:cyclophilin family peptidyl-prolyl cis-trans isomerase/HEAT repeat protein
VLTGLLRASEREDHAESAAYALGAVAGRQPLTDETLGALLDRADRDPARPATAAALYPIGRLERVPEPWIPRVEKAARAVLAGGGSLRSFAVRALERVGLPAIQDLARAASSGDLGVAERADAARALGRMGAPGREAAAGALARVLQDRAVTTPAGISTDTFNVLVALAEAVGQDAPRQADPSLYALAGLPLPEKEPAGLLLRTVTLRCAAALVLARAAYDAPILAKCDPDPDGTVGLRTKLAALLRRPLVGDRRKVFRALAESPHVRVREAALEAIGQHPELEDTGRALLVQALSAEQPGVVATAAEAIVQHPERVLVLAASERRAALDPRAPPPTSHPAMDLPADVGAALVHAIGRAWHDDAVETRTLLLDAAVAVNLPEARAAATHACADANVTVREHAVRALRALGVAQPACPMPKAAGGARDAGSSAPRATAGVLSSPVRARFKIAGATLAIVFEPELTPLAASRFVALARSGFYKGIVVHRVVPGYVVQFGDPGADGYGGSGDLLRCETSPVPFGDLDVGVALAGRDTGSSQIFVTLGRYPKLDGEYARVGHAEGDWGAVAEGDVIESVEVEE